MATMVDLGPWFQALDRPWRAGEVLASVGSTGRCAAQGTGSASLGLQEHGVTGCRGSHLQGRVRLVTWPAPVSLLLYS